MSKDAGLRESDTEGLRGETGMGQMYGGKDGDPGGTGQKRQRRQRCGRKTETWRVRDGDRGLERQEDRKDTEDRDRGPDAKEDREGAGTGWALRIQMELTAGRWS